MKTIKELETCNCQECKYKADLLKKVMGLIDEEFPCECTDLRQQEEFKCKWCKLRLKLKARING